MTQSMQPYQVAVYYFPGYHPSSANDEWHGKGWTEWELVRRAEPRFPGHQQPKVPLWGYEDESSPLAAEKKIAAAADHGISAFIYDWYWYRDAPFLNGALDTGFMQAGNNDRLAFALMWANHDWINIFPYKRTNARTVLAEGAVSRQVFDHATNFIIENYFAHPSYWKIDGRPYFSLYELMRLTQGLGGIDQTRAALDDFRARTRAALGCDIHLNAVVWGIQILPGEQKVSDANSMLAALGFDSVTSYVWIHHTPMTQFPTIPYRQYAAESIKDWQRFTSVYTLPYYPNVTMGWDSSPRTVQSDSFDNLGYPFISTLSGNTPQEFAWVLEQARAFLETGQTNPPIITLNAWNEWTEGSYLEPDAINGMGYLEAIKRVFGAR